MENSVAQLIALMKETKQRAIGRFDLAAIEKVHRKNKRRRWNNKKK